MIAVGKPINQTDVGFAESDMQSASDLHKEDSDSHSSEEKEEAKVSIRKTNLRWLMLVFGCFFLMGSYFCYDNPAPVQNQLQEPPLNLSYRQYTNLYSVYSFPNMILPLFGGVFLDKIGVK